MIDVKFETGSKGLDLIKLHNNNENKYKEFVLLNIDFK